MSSDERARIVREGFARQAKAFARSPLHRDPERLRRLVAFVAPRPGERLLDVGCGPGLVVGALAGEGRLVIGIDLTPAMLREAAGRGGLYMQGDVARLPFRDGSFDRAVSRNTFHHLSDPPGVAREMARVVRPGGRVVIEDMLAPDDPAQRAYLETIERLRDSTHARTLTRDGLRTLAGAAGLTGIAEEPVRFVIDFDEWVDRAYPAPRDREEARRMMEACLTEDRCGLRIWREGESLKFERRSLLLGATRPE